MEDAVCMGSSCPLSQISWLWYALAVILAFGFGAVWYAVLFSKTWLKAVQYKCVCGADLSNGETCTCKNRSILPMIMQLAATAMVGFMYFILTPISVWLSVIVLVTVAAWMKAGLKYKIADWNRFITLASIEVGYFAIASIIFILFSML